MIENTTNIRSVTIPSYTFFCEECKKNFSIVCSIKDYSSNQNCPHCNNSNVYREYNIDNACINYINGLSEAKTLQEYAEKQTKKYGQEKCNEMRQKFVEYKQNKVGGIKELPTGMTRYTNSDSMPLPKIKKRVKRDKK